MRNHFVLLLIFRNFGRAEVAGTRECEEKFCFSSHFTHYFVTLQPEEPYGLSCGSKTDYT